MAAGTSVGIGADMVVMVVVVVSPGSGGRNLPSFEVMRKFLKVRVFNTNY